ncbi:uncharacterized protein METZ01_LOCUS312980, partial [marine metagenome]
RPNKVICLLVKFLLKSKIWPKVVFGFSILIYVTRV